MSHNSATTTAFQFHYGVMSIITTDAYKQLGTKDIQVAKTALVKLESDHSCLYDAGWGHALKGWSFQCIQGAAGWCLFLYIFL
jgi:hypothetical protein